MASARLIGNNTVMLTSALEISRNDGYYMCPYDEGELEVVKKALLAEEPFVNRAIKLILRFIVQNPSVRKLEDIARYRSANGNVALESDLDFYYSKVEHGGVLLPPP